MPATKKPAKTAKAAKTVPTRQELHDQLATKRQDLVDAVRSHKAGELVNPRVLGATRKEIARLLTAIRQDEQKETK